MLRHAEIWGGNYTSSNFSKAANNVVQLKGSEVIFCLLSEIPIVTFPHVLLCVKVSMQDFYFLAVCYCCFYFDVKQTEV